MAATISFTPAGLTLSLKDKRALNVSYQVSDKSKVVFRSGDTGVATVVDNGDGTVTINAVGLGSTTIVASNDNTANTFNVSVAN